MEGEADQQGQDIIVELVNRIRILESKYTLMSERLLMVNQNMIEHHKQLTKELKVNEGEMRDLKNDLEKVKNILKHLSEEAANFARKDEVKLLEKYIKLWNPINFVTDNDVKNIVQRELRNLNEAKAPEIPAKAVQNEPVKKKEVAKNG